MEREVTCVVKSNVYEEEKWDLGGLDGTEQEELWMARVAAHPAGGKAGGEGGRSPLMLFSHREGCL